jgi:hypothetical protein
MTQEEIAAVNEVLKDSPLRSDEFPLIATEILDMSSYDFKEHYDATKEGMPPEMHIIIADSVEVEVNENIILWLGDKRLGIIQENLFDLISGIEAVQKLSRVVIIENPESVPTYYDTYMKAVFIVTNAEGAEVSYGDGRFKSLRVLTQAEINAIDNRN